MRRIRRSFRLSAIESHEARTLLSGQPVLVADVVPGSTGSNPREFTNVNGILFFVADDPAAGAELWKTDGTAGGTSRVLDINPGTNGSYPSNLTNLNGILIFAADNGTSGEELWRSDGTTAGTVMIKDIFAGVDSSRPTIELAFGNNLLLIASSAEHSGELWKTDGTANGTVLVKDINPGTSSSYPFYFQNVSGTIFFGAQTNDQGTELWKTNGTTAGTVLVRDINPGTESSSPSYMTNLGGTLYFAASDPVNGGELWKSDGTTAGTVLVKDLAPGSDTAYGNTLPNSSWPSYLINVNGVLYFAAYTNNDPDLLEVWKSDGTAAGTTLLHEFPANGSTDYISETMNVNGTLFFRTSPDFGTVQNPLAHSLYASNGTPGGLVEIARQSTTSGEFAAVGNRAYFASSNAQNGLELWSSNGTLAGTSLVADLRSGATGADPRNLTNVNGTLYFSADNGTNGRELWKISPQTAPSAAPVVNGPATPSNSLRPNITWNPIDGATKYEVWIKNQSTNVNPYRVVTVNSNSYLTNTDFGIGRYNVWVRAGNDAGWGPWSGQFNFQVNTRVTVNDPGRFLGTHRPTLTWQALPGAARYDIWINNKSAGVSQVIRNTNVTGTSFTPSSDLPIGTYEAWVRGVDASGIPGTWSTTVLFNVVPAPVVTQGNNSTFDRSPLLAWQQLNGAVKYEVFLRNQLSGATVVYQQNINALSYQVASDLADGPYRWWVLGISAQNIRSFWTNPIDIFVGGRTEFITPSGTATATPTFTWKTVDGTQRYDLWVDRVGGPTQVIREQNLLTTSFTPSTPLTAGTYRMWIRAISTGGETGPWSLTTTFTVAAVSQPFSPHESAPTEAIACVLESPLPADKPEQPVHDDTLVPAPADPAESLVIETKMETNKGTLNPEHQHVLFVDAVMVSLIEEFDREF